MCKEAPPERIVCQFSDLAGTVLQQPCRVSATAAIRESVTVEHSKEEEKGKEEEERKFY